MARPNEGWKLRHPRGPHGSIKVRFSWAGVDHERSTGTRDTRRAEQEAARIYAQVIATEQAKPVRHAGSVDLERALTRWLGELSATLDPGTVGSYLDYSKSHWLPFFAGRHSVTTEAVAEYMRERLSRVSASTVRKELSALRGFVTWAASKRLMPEIVVPSVPKRTVGTKYEKRRRAAAIPLSVAEVQKILRALPAWSSSKKVDPFPIRARFIVAYESGLRPELLDQLSVPEHYQKGSDAMTITPELDKGRWARRVPLSQKARKALDEVCPEDGPIFGAHDYREHLRAAADAALPPDRAALFTGAHLRSARATHWLDEGAPITAVQFLLGHKRMETTARYVRAAEKAAETLVKKRR
jgi:integrase